MSKITCEQLLAPFVGAKKIIFELEFTKAFTFDFSHHEKLRGFVVTLAQRPDNFSDVVMIDAIENGHSEYQKGMRYRFGVTVFSRAVHLLKVMARNIQSSEFIATLSDKHQLGRHTRFTDMFDGITLQPIARPELASAFNMAFYSQKLEHLKHTPQWGIQFVTPLLLTEPFRCEQGLETALPFERLWEAVINRFAHQDKQLLMREALELLPKPTALLQWQSSRYVHLFYSKHRKPCGGQLALGWLLLDDSWHDQHRLLLLLASLFGIGAGVARGHGQFALYEEGVEPLFNRMRPASSMLEKLMFNPAMQRHAQNYAEKLPHLAPEVLFEDFTHAQTIWSQCHWPLPSVSVYERDTGNKLRTFTTTHALNSALLSGVQAGMSTQFKQFWHPDSFAYQAGKSRHNTHDRVQALINAEHHYFYKSDIKNCFESISKSMITQLIALYFPGDPLQFLFADWLSACEEKGIEGLPLGLPFSPVLCNLFLSELDFTFTHSENLKDVKLLRFADDIVLLAKIPQTLERAITTLHAWLANHHLSLNPQKSAQGHINKGFEFLGWRFIDGYSVKQDKSADRVVNTSTQNARQAKQVIVIAGMPTQVKVENGKLVVQQQGVSQSYPWHSLEAILCIGNHNVTLPVIKQAMLKKVPIHLSDQFGNYQGSCCGHFQQHQALANVTQLQSYLTAHKQTLANYIIAKRIHTIYDTLRRRVDDKTQLKALLNLKAKAEQTQSLESLRGVEGAAAKILFQQFKNWFADDWHFTARKKRPAPDPINAMLSLGYTQLYALTDSILRTFSLWPYAELYHTAGGEHACLASDYMEMYRAEVERTVLTVINRRQITPDDFNLTPQGAELSSEGRKTFLRELSKKLYTQNDQNVILQNMINDIDSLYRNVKKYTQPQIQFGKPPTEID